MNTYITKAKVEKIKLCQRDFEKIYKRTIYPFTRKSFFYFHVERGVKYVHKDSLRFVYTNADTYTKDIDPIICDVERRYAPIDIIEFLESYTGHLLPEKIGQNDKFIEYKYLSGESATIITRSEFNALRACVDLLPYTPFYNSMAYNLVRYSGGIRLVDLKHFEPKDNKPFFIYMYNENINLNTLYIEKHAVVGRATDHLMVDYPIKHATHILY